MAVNKVVYDDKVLIDLSNDTVTPETLQEGIIAHSANGEQITGTLSLGTFETWEFEMEDGSKVTKEVNVS